MKLDDLNDELLKHNQCEHFEIASFYVFLDDPTILLVYEDSIYKDYGILTIPSHVLSISLHFRHFTPKNLTLPANIVILNMLTVANIYLTERYVQFNFIGSYYT